MRVRFAVLAMLGFAVAAAAQPRPAKLTGRVAADTTMRPIAGAEVFLPTLNRTTLTDDKGGFVLTDIPPGTHRVRARKLGYAMYDMSIRFGDGETVLRAIVLPRITTLDTITTVGDPNVPLSFLDHRAIGLGHFMTRLDLENLRGRQLSSALNQVRGAGMVRGSTGQAWIMSGRYVAPLRSLSPGARRNEPGDPIWYPMSEFEKQRGMKPGCYAHVYLNGTLLNRGSPAEPVDINEYAPEMLEAVEYYGSPAQTPMEYSTLNSPCGVLVLHTRRSK